jgi:hypothetical protein
VTHTRRLVAELKPDDVIWFTPGGVRIRRIYTTGTYVYITRIVRGGRFKFHVKDEFTYDETEGAWRLTYVYDGRERDKPNPTILRRFGYRASK